MTIEVDVALFEPTQIMAILGPIVAAAGLTIGGDGITIVFFEGIDIGIGLPDLPDGSIKFKISQTCPGFPYCGRKSGPCKISKSTPSIDPFYPLRVIAQGALPQYPPTLPRLKIDKIAVTIQLPKLGFALHCPNSQQPMAAVKLAPLEVYAGAGQTPPQS